MTAETITLPSRATALLLLEDGTTFFGQGLGAHNTISGEICFNTSLTGYQETITDPSYAGQIITFTFPHIGNVGANIEDTEATAPHARGIVVRNTITSPSNMRSESSLQEWLKSKNMTGIAGVDTRKLTRHIRAKGAQNAAIYYPEQGREVNLSDLREQLSSTPSMKGMELANTVTAGESYPWKQGTWTLENGFSEENKPSYRVVVVDFGVKHNILRCLASAGCEVTVVPAKTSYKEIMAHGPDGVFLSNGPGDPSATGEYAIPVIRELLEADIPLFGICLGHQLLSLALGLKTTKMFQGHRGSNHPVQDLKTRKVEITSQNHGFVVEKDSLPDSVEISHLSLFDGTVEGVSCKDRLVFSVQYHPESSPGPHDSHYLFDRFVANMEAVKTSDRLQNNA